MNVIARLEFKLVYSNSAVQRFNHYTYPFSHISTASETEEGIKTTGARFEINCIFIFPQSYQMISHHQHISLWQQCRMDLTERTVWYRSCKNSPDLKERNRFFTQTGWGRCDGWKKLQFYDTAFSFLCGLFKKNDISP